MTITLILKDKKGITKEYTFKDISFIKCGRAIENDIVIPDQTVSSNHFKIYFDEGNYFIEDLNSTNGTYLNGNRIKKSQIKDSDIISFSTYTILVKISSIKLPVIELEVIENSFDERKKFIINKSLVFIGSSGKADIPAMHKNILLPISDFTVALRCKNEKWLITPLNSEFVLLNDNKIQNDTELKDNDIIQVGITKFLFKYLQ